MEEEEDITPQQTEKLIQFQDLTGIDDMAQCKELLKNNNWDLEAAVQHHLVQQVRVPCVNLFLLSDRNAMWRLLYSHDLNFITFYTLLAELKPSL